MAWNELIATHSTRSGAKAYYQRAVRWGLKNDKLIEVLRMLFLKDLFFLLVVGLGGWFCDSEWVFSRCREVQADPDGHLDIWAREHFKTTIITYGLTIQDILNNPEICVCIMSHTQDMARKSMMAQIKREFEANELLKACFPDILWEDPKKEAPRWGEETGLIVKRQGNPREATLEAWGLVDGQPTSKHYDLMIYDDIVTAKSVRSPEMNETTTREWSNSLNLGKTDPFTGNNLTRRRYIGTYWSFNDTYTEIVKRGAAKERKYPGGVVVSDDGMGTREIRTSGYLSQEALLEKEQIMDPYVFGCQIMLDPKWSVTSGFRDEWLKWWDARNRNNLNIYIIIDPAGENATKKSDFSAFTVFGVDSLENYMVIEHIRDKISLDVRTTLLFELYWKYRPLGVGYERYGKDSDIVYIEYRMQKENFRFSITELAGLKSKKARIGMLIPPWKQGKIFLPTLESRIHRVNWQGQTVDMIQQFIDEEYRLYGSTASHDDSFDNLARMLDPNLGVRYPSPYGGRENEYQYAQFSRQR